MQAYKKITSLENGGRVASYDIRVRRLNHQIHVGKGACVEKSVKRENPFRRIFRSVPDADHRMSFAQLQS